MVRSVGAGLCSARCSDEISTHGRSRAPPLQGPRKKVTSIWISNAPSIDGRCSTETSCKFGTPVSGGAYQNARKVTTEWNARPKRWCSPEFRGRKHPASPSTLFSPIFSLAREKMGPSETTSSRRFATTSQSATLTAPLEGEPWGVHLHIVVFSPFCQQEDDGDEGGEDLGSGDGVPDAVDAEEQGQEDDGGRLEHQRAQK